MNQKIKGIERIGEREYYAVSSAQKRLFILNQMEGVGTSYNIPSIFIIEGSLDRQRFERSFEELSARHEALRTSFEIIDGEPMQKIHKRIDFKIDCIEAQEKDIADIVKGFVKPFDLKSAPLFRVGLVKLSEDKHVMLFDIHHIIADGISMEIILKEFACLYEGEKLPEVAIQYKDFSVWQNALIQTEEVKRQEEYWLKRFEGEIPVLNLPTDYSRPINQSYEGEKLRFEINNDLSSRLRKLASETGASIYMVLLSIYYTLLWRLSGQEDIVVGSPTAGRNHAELDNMIGLFVNTLALRNYPKGSKTFKEFLAEVKENTLTALENQEYQFEKLIENLYISRDLSRNPLFDTMFVLQNKDIPEIGVGNLKFSPYSHENRVSKFDLTFEIVEKECGIEYRIEYCTKLLKEATIVRLGEYFINILKEVIENPGIRLGDIEIMHENEKTHILKDFNNTKSTYPKDRMVYQLFEEQVRKDSEKLAVIFEDRKLTYSELNIKSNQLARMLREKGVKRDNIVAIMVERSPEMSIGIMGILKAGAAYLPISPEYPSDRIDYMLEDSEASLLLTVRRFADKINFGGEIIYIEEDEIYSGDDSNLESVNEPTDLAYVIYTSGSTGRPKGVMIEHYSLVNRLNWMQKAYPIGPDDIILQKTPFTFDVSVWELIWWAIQGATVCFLKPGGEKDPEEIVQSINKNKVTTMHFVPSMLTTFLNYVEEKVCEEMLGSLRQVFASGEALSLQQVNRFNRLLNEKVGIKLINLYGPTEATVDVSYFDCSQNGEIDSVPIGKPIDNIQLYILNSHNMLQPINVPGELHIAGDGLARGYINRMELTNEKFVTNPYMQGSKMYKTGDLAKWREDGNIEYLGRIDNQVKIRGFRIELGEIESELLKHEDVKDAVVSVWEDNEANKYICSYYVSNVELAVATLREHLLNYLPEYMIPSYFVRLEKIPLSSNGKIDRKALPKPGGVIDTGKEYIAPESQVERELAKLWQEILGVDRVGILDNFFELGGHSLKASVLVSRIHKAFNVEIKLTEIFKAPSIKELSKLVMNAKNSIYKAIERIEEKEYYGVSSAQKRLFILNQMEGVGTSYNIPSIFTIEGSLDRPRFEGAFEELAARHEALRTSFEIIEGEPMQKVHKRIDFKVDCIEAQEKDLSDIVKGFVKPFDLKSAPLFRVGLVKLSENKHVMLFDIHHIIADGISMEIILKEFACLYEGEKLPEVLIQYKDFSVWQNALIQTEEVKQQEEYWLKQLAGEIPALSFGDYTRPVLQSFEGDSICFELDSRLARGLKEIARETNTTLYMVMLAAYNVLLSRYSGQDDIIVGTPVAGRQHGDIENTVGMFVNTLAMRNYPKGDMTFKEFLPEVKKNTLQAFENQDYMFEDLVERLNIPRDLSRNPLFDTMFVLQNMNYSSLEMNGFHLTPLKFDQKVSMFDLTLEAVEHDEVINLEFEYCTKLFKEETIARMVGHFTNLVKSIVDAPDKTLSELNILSNEEREKVLSEFNNTQVLYPQDKTLNVLFEEQVLRKPDSIALVLGDKQLTYRELNEKANSIAGMLQGKGIKSGSIVGLVADESFEMIIGIIGILKSGAAYVPVDLSFPADRINYIFIDSGADVLLTMSKYKDIVAGFGGEIIELDSAMTSSDDGVTLENESSPSDAAYMIYTSGTTGMPKGVIIEHKSIVNQLIGLQDKFGFDQTCNYILLAKYTFDVSVQHIFLPLTTGGKLFMPGQEVTNNPDVFWKFVIANKINVLDSVPAYLNTMLDFVKEKVRLKYVVVGADVFTKSLYDKIKKTITVQKIINIYGPTETTINATAYECCETEEAETIPIGKPLQNYRVYVLDGQKNLLPIGIPGELYISGVGVARGYHNKNRLTKESFVENPFIPGEKIYKTGDMVKWLPDGNIEFLGRMDFQVKIRGFRIELDEIELKLLKHSLIKETVVVAKEDSNKVKYLCAYIVAEESLKPSEIREYLSKELPGHMIPSYFIQLEKMPLTTNGKIDRKALPEPGGVIDTGKEYIAPESQLEKELAELWQEILGVDRVGILDNFFELGGHSLKASVLVSRIHKEFNVEIQLKEIFKTPTIKELSMLITDAKKSNYKAIERIGEREYYEVSSAQKRLFILEQMEGIGTSYNIPSIYIIEGSLNRQRFERAFEELSTRHEALRTSFEIIDGEPVQKIHKRIDLKVEYIETQEKDIADIVKNFVKPFDLKSVPLFRVKLVKLSEDKHVMLFDIHHIIADGTSMEIIFKEFACLYEGEKLPEVLIQYKDFSVWQNALIQTEEVKQQEEYWLKQLAGEIPALSFGDYTRPVLQSFEGDSICFELDSRLARGLKEIARETNTTLYMVMLAAYNVLLSRYSGQDDIIVGSPVAGRQHGDIENTVGMFVNTLAMRNYPKGDMTFKELLAEVKENTLQAFENQDCQFEELIDKLNIPRDLSRNPLFDTMFVLQNVDHEEIVFKNLSFKPYDLKSKISKFDLTLYAVEKEDSIQMELEYCTKIFSRETGEALTKHFASTIKEVIKNPQIKLKDICILTEDDKEKILYDFNRTETDYPRNKGVYELFEEQVEKTPDDIAVVFRDWQLTYRELNEKANRIAWKLKEKGVKEDTVVGIMVERSLQMVIAILGILKAGGAYVPIDPDYPEERIKYLLENSKASILLTKDRINDNVVLEGKDVISVVECIKQQDLSKENLNGKYNPDRLIYVLYTSGSTGNPKGVMVKNHAYVNLLNWFTTEFNIGHEDNVLMIAPASFDLAQKNLYAPLIKGGRLYLYEPGMYDYNIMSNWIEDKKITLINCTPSAFYPLMDFNMDSGFKRLKTLRFVFLGGEPINLGKFKDWVKSPYYNGEIINTYGPTECTDIASFYRVNNEKIDSMDTVPIGKPIHNAKLYVLDKNCSLLPRGVAGELCIGGVGLARGYFNSKELTREKFIECKSLDNEKVYKTGDMVKWLPDGNLEYLGRVDFQVKIRGFRIELEEIESKLLKYSLIKETVVVAKEDPNKVKYLCAYIVGEESIKPSEIREYLSKKLPGHMIPSYFIQLEKMPLTPNGKIDRKSLPEPGGVIDTGKEYIAPESPAERKLAEMWQEILGVEKVGILDNIFDLGGHSLKATTLVSKIHKEFNVEIQLKDIFKSPTIKELSKLVTDADNSIYKAIERIGEREYYEVSSAQKRMYIINQFEQGTINYNIPDAIVVDGNLDFARVCTVFKKLAKRHEIFRTSFHLIDGQLMQKVHKNIELKVEYIDIADDSSTQEEIFEGVQDVMNTFVRPFDLSKAPLFRVGVINLADEKSVLIYDFHHIIADGTSLGILLSEFSDLYTGKELPELSIQYKDFSEWQNKMFKAGLIKKQEEYWCNVFKNDLPILNLPTDYLRPPVQSFKGDTVLYELDKNLVDELKGIASQTNATLFMVLLAAYDVFLSKYTDEEDIIVGVPTTGRQHADLMNLMGMFINTIALRNFPSGNKTFMEFISEVKKNTLTAYENQDYQFEELVETLKISRNPSRNPLFDTMFLFENNETNGIDIPGLKCTPYPLKNSITKFDIGIIAMQTENGIKLIWDYRIDLFKRETINRQVEYFVTILRNLVRNPVQKLSEISMLSEDEEKSILVDFNKLSPEKFKDDTIHELFEEQVKLYPDQLAIVYNNQSLSYGELNRKANQLARRLRNAGAMPDQVVGVLLGHPIDCMVAILGVLKSGSAFLTLDPMSSSDDKVAKLTHAVVNILVSKECYVNDIPYTGSVICFNDTAMEKEDGSDLNNVNKPSDLAYITYTSGTMGVPKGIMVEHRNAVNVLTAFTNEYNGQGNYLLKKVNSSNISIVELLGWSVGGNKAVISDCKTDKVLDDIIHAIEENKITHIHFTSALFYDLIDLIEKEGTDKLQSVKFVFVSGEKMDYKTIRKMSNLMKNARIEFLYSLAETSTYSLVYSLNKIQENGFIPVGKPIQNLKAFILDRNHQVVPIGKVGELYICGLGVARGYIDKEYNTNENFKQNSLFGENRVYKTGDMARWLPDGNIEYIGRMNAPDERMDLGVDIVKIEAFLIEQESVKRAVVVPKKDSGENKLLCMYILQKSTANRRELMEYLKNALPEYMVPSKMIFLDKVPMNSCYKTDLKNLPDDSAHEDERNYSGLVENIEQDMIKAWKDVLGLDEISPSDNFFRIGGSSIKAIQVMVQMKDYALNLNDFLRYPVLSDLCRNIKPSDRHFAACTVCKTEVPFLERRENIYAGEDLALEGVHDEKILENIEPFNEVFYKSCVYNALFPVIRHYNKSIMPFLVNDIITYNFDRDKSGVKLQAKFITVKDENTILDEMGITYSSKIASSDVIKDISVAISKDKPVIIYTDCYYESIRKDMFQKNHWPHCLLVFGYNNSAKRCHIIEHSDVNGLDYDKWVMDDVDIVNSYENYFDLFRKGEEFPTYFEYELKDNDLSNAHSKDSYLNVFIENILAYKKEIIEGLDSLLLFKDNFGEITSSEAELMKCIENLLYTINYIVNVKRVERYRIQKLISEETELINIIDSVIEKWNGIRTVTGMYLYSNIYKPKKFLMAQENIQKIYECERQFYELLFDILGKY